MTEPGGDPSPSWPAGWYPDPLRRFGHRYFNGERWTADVADGGSRFVDPLGAGPGAAVPPTRAPLRQPARPRIGRAIASMVLAIAGVGVGWVPVFFVAGVVCAVLAVLFGIAGLRASRRQGGAGRGFAIAGLAIAPLAVAASVVGLLLTIVLFDRVDEYLDEGPRRADVTRCVADATGFVDVSGTITNLSDRERSYVLRIRVERTGTDNAVGGGHVEVDDVPAGDTADWSTRLRVEIGDVSCSITAVSGPFPFGIDPGT